MEGRLVETKDVVVGERERRNRRPYDRNRNGRNAKAPYQRRENVRPAADSRPANNDSARSEAPKTTE